MGKIKVEEQQIGKDCDVPGNVGIIQLLKTSFQKTDPCCDYSLVNEQGIILFIDINGGILMVKITHAAISKVTSEVQDVIDEGKKPLIRLAMGIG